MVRYLMRAVQRLSAGAEEGWPAACRTSATARLLNQSSRSHGGMPTSQTTAAPHCRTRILPRLGHIRGAHATLRGEQLQAE